MQIFFSVFWWIYFFVFFTGYPLAYVFINIIGRNKKMKHLVADKIYPAMPLTYAFTATAFWILMIYSGRMDFVFQKIAIATPSVLAIIYSFSALLFWHPFFRKNIYPSLLHSLPFMLLPLVHMILKAFRHGIDLPEYAGNLLRIYTAGFVLYMLLLIILLIFKWLLHKLSFFMASKSLNG
jgi:hypothetical protein